MPRLQEKKELDRYDPSPVQGLHQSVAGRVEAASRSSPSAPCWDCSWVGCISSSGRPSLNLPRKSKWNARWPPAPSNRSTASCSCTKTTWQRRWNSSRVRGSIRCGGPRQQTERTAVVRGPKRGGCDRYHPRQFSITLPHHAVRHGADELPYPVVPRTQQRGCAYRPQSNHRELQEVSGRANETTTGRNRLVNWWKCMTRSRRKRTS